MDKLDESIAKQLRKDERKEVKRRRPLRDRASAERIKPLPEKLPPLTPPYRGKPAPIKRYDHPVFFRWTRRDWWRFRRAAHAQGKHGGELVRELCLEAIRQYEESAPEK